MRARRCGFRPAVLAACGCGVALLATPPRLPAQHQPTMPVRSWESLVTAVALGTPVAVTRTGRTEVRGRLAAIDGRSITIERDGVRLVIAADSVVRVDRTDVRRRVRRLSIPAGMLAGALVLTAIDAGSSHPEPGSAFLMGAVLIGLPAGAVAASAWPAARPLYEAVPPAAEPWR